MAEQTITEALAEIKTLVKRLDKKRQFVIDYLYRQERIRDPLEGEGGSIKALEATQQSIRDLEDRIVAIRAAINSSNQDTTITVDGDTRTVADWLTWRREVAPSRQQFLNQLRNKINQVRQEARQKGIAVTDGQAQSLDDVLVNVPEKAVADELEHIEQILGSLDGQLSLLNATTVIEV